jgi:hypothetical protein
MGYVHQQSIYDYYLGIFQVASALKTPQLYAAIQRREIVALYRYENAYRNHLLQN